MTTPKGPYFKEQWEDGKWRVVGPGEVVGTFHNSQHGTAHDWADRLNAAWLAGHAAARAEAEELAKAMDWAIESLTQEGDSDNVTCALEIQQTLAKWREAAK